MSVAGTGAEPGELAPAVAAALAAAEIPPSRLGPARRANLTEAERELYFWILRRFATNGRPSSSEVRAAAERLGLDTEDALATLSREDLVHSRREGEISVAYPFSGQPTAHRVRFPRSGGGLSRRWSSPARFAARATRAAAAARC